MLAFITVKTTTKKNNITEVEQNEEIKEIMELILTSVQELTTFKNIQCRMRYHQDPQNNKINLASQLIHLY